MTLTLAKRVVEGGGELLPDSEVTETWVAERGSEMCYVSVTVMGDGSFSCEYSPKFVPGKSTLEFVAVVSLMAMCTVQDPHGPWFADEGSSVTSLGVSVKIEGQ